MVAVPLDFGKSGFRREIRVFEVIKRFPTFLRKLGNEETSALQDSFGLGRFLRGLIGGFGSLFKAVTGGRDLAGTIFLQVF